MPVEGKIGRNQEQHVAARIVANIAGLVAIGAALILTMMGMEMFAVVCMLLAALVAISEALLRAKEDGGGVA